jgi:hypothetical protein
MDFKTNILSKNTKVMTNYRQIDRVVTAKQTVFGAGFKSYDVEQQQLGRMVQPFLQMANYYMTQLIANSQRPC